MINNKKIIFFLIWFLLAGIFLGYSFEKRQHSIASSGTTDQSIENTGHTGNSQMTSDKRDNMTIKLELLKSYTDFVLLPPDKIGDPVAYSNNMAKQVEAIGDSEISTKFYATGEKDGREQKIVYFLDYLNSDIQSDLK